MPARRRGPAKGTRLPRRLSPQLDYCPAGVAPSDSEGVGLKAEDVVGWVTGLELDDVSPDWQAAKPMTGSATSSKRSSSMADILLVSLCRQRCQTVDQARPEQFQMCCNHKN